MGFFDWLLGPRHSDLADDGLQQAIHQVMAGVDPRLQAMHGARERLAPAVAPAVAHALDYARSIAARQADCIPLQASRWAASPVLRALFARPEDITATVNASPDLREFLDSGGDGCGDTIYCIVAATPQQHTTLGTALEGELLRRDVERHSISFGDFRLVGFSASPQALQQRTQEMVLEALVLDALAEITASKARGRALEAEHGLLRHRLALMAQSRAGLNGLEAEGAHHQDVAQLRQQLADNEAALAAAHSGSGWLEATLEQLQAHLAAAEESLPLRPTVLWLDPMNLMTAPQAANAAPVALTEIARPGRPLRLTFPAAIPRAEVAPPHLDFDSALRLL